MSNGESYSSLRRQIWIYLSSNWFIHRRFIARFLSASTMNIHRCDSKQIEPLLTHREPAPRVGQPEEDWVQFKVWTRAFSLWSRDQLQRTRLKEQHDRRYRDQTHWENNNRTVCMKINMLCFTLQHYFHERCL